MTRKELEQIDGICTLFNFGKYKGKTLLHVIDNDPQYIIWCINNVKDFNINNKLKVELLSQYNQHIRYHQDHYYKSLMKKYDINAIDTIILEEAQEILKKNVYKTMTKEFFEKLLDNNDISWNDKIVITIFNPFKRWYKFGEPKYLVFKGYLLYHEGDEVVHVSVIDEDEKLITLFFDFDKILNIEKYE